MKTMLVAALLMSSCAFACNDDYTKVYFEKDGHLYFTVTGSCGGEISYTIHSADCSCGEGSYEVKDS